VGGEHRLCWVKGIQRERRQLRHTRERRPVVSAAPYPAVVAVIEMGLGGSVCVKGVCVCVYVKAGEGSLWVYCVLLWRIQCGGFSVNVSEAGLGRGCGEVFRGECIVCFVQLKVSYIQ
jgi:hypothetical protein